MLQTVMWRRAALLLLACGVCAAQQERKNPYGSDPDAIEAGRGAFRIYCSPCHGIGGVGGRGPDLTVGVYSSGDTDGALLEVISEGISGTEMPGYEERMSPDSLWRMVSYVRSLARPTSESLPGDARAGKEIYWDKGGCAACHRINNKGGRLGPDLSRVGRSRSAAYLREALVKPGEAISPEYQRVTVVTGDGKRVVGIGLNYDNFSALVMDANEDFHSFLRSEVQSIERDYESLMPGYGDTLSDSETDDLLAYLAGLRGEAER